MTTPKDDKPDTSPKPKKPRRKFASTAKKAGYKRVAAANRIKSKGNNSAIKPRICIKCEKALTSAAFAGPKNKICSLCKEKERVEQAEKARLRIEATENTTEAHTAATEKDMRDASNKVFAARYHREARTREDYEAIVAEKKRLQRLGAADRELASRVLARRRLLHFIQRFKKDYEPGWVHEDICARLERFFDAVQRQESPRLILAVPPRHGKSEIASKNFPAWIMGHRPEFEIIAASYNVSLPMGFSRKVRGMMQTAQYKNIFPNTHMDKSSQSAETWATTAGGGYVAAGVSGGITGKGAHVFIIDDPVKDAQEADSETIKEATWDWWGATAKTRLAPGGGVLVIQTRWSDDDLAGRMLSMMREQQKELDNLIEDAEDRLAAAITSGSTPAEIELIEDEIKGYNDESRTIDNWEVVSYPAIATDDEFEDLETHKIYTGEDMDETLANEIKASAELGAREYEGYRLLRFKGEALHPERFPLPRLRNMQRSMQPRHWSALYQQNPVPDEGIYFTKSMFRYRPTQVGHQMHIYIAWDLAIGSKQTNDYTVGAVIGVDYDDHIHVIDIIRGRWDTYGIVETVLDVAAKYKPQMVGMEKGHLEMAIKPVLQKRMRERREYYTFAEGKDALTPVTDKSVRARPLQGRMQQGMVTFPNDQPWVEVAQQELLRFPAGVHDDIVDALSWAVRLSMRYPPPQPPRNKRNKSWRDKLKNHIVGRGGDKTPMSV